MYVFEPANTEHCEQIAMFVVQVITTSVDASVQEKALFVENTRENLAKWLAEPERNFHLTARSEGQLVGVVLVRDFWNLCHLFVAPEHQGRGLGRQLLDAALIGCAAKSPRGIMRLNASRNAVEFYRHMGFSEVSDGPAPFKGTQFERKI
jgi:GNAT superfamily N-acetyltransferase